jgi:hypothetical protein
MPAVSLVALVLLAAPSARASDAVADPVRDHATLLRIAGEYAVEFAFDETVLLQPGYERAAAMRSSGDEAVIVIEDTPTKVSLQHLLVDGKSGHVTKHWREDWTYQASQRFEFSADQTWTVRALSPQETQGAWTQCVYEVSDAPRYCGTGRWIYNGGAATWTSDDSWRPLPRREYTRRSDYNALRVVNRHTVTPSGWTHEQFNTKVQRKPDGSLVEIAREFGFDDYRRDSQVDFTPAHTYWKATTDFWAGVRKRWAVFLDQPPGVHLKTKLDGMAMIMPLFEQAATLEEGGKVKATDTDAVFAQWVEAAPATR